MSRTALCILLLAASAAAQDRGAHPPPPSTLSGLDQGRYVALLMAVETYAHRDLDDLRYPVGDARRLGELLTRSYGFDSTDVLLLENPARTDIEAAFAHLDTALTDADNLLVFFAGHGLSIPYDSPHYRQDWLGSEDDPYWGWLPADADPSDPNTWIRNVRLWGFLRSNPSRHTLLVSDACYSASLFEYADPWLAAVGPDAPPDHIVMAHSRRSRRALTSGADEVVPDRSVFIEALLHTLDANRDRWLSGTTLYSRLLPDVSQQGASFPQYRHIHDTGDQFGDFVFVRTLPDSLAEPEPPPSFSGIWEPGAGGRALFTGIDTLMLEQTMQAMWNERKLLVDLETYTDRGLRLYAGIWQTSPEPGISAHTSLTESDLMERIDGFGRIVDLETFVEQEERRYLIVHHWGGETPGDTLLLHLDASTLLRHHETLRALGYRLVDTEAYDHEGDIRFLGLWREEDAPASLIRLDLDTDAFEAVASTLSQLGMGLVDVERYAHGGAELHLGVWQQNAGGRSHRLGLGEAAFRDDAVRTAETGSTLIDVDVHR